MNAGVELDRAVAEALGLEVCRGTLIQPPHWYRPWCDRCGEEPEGGQVGQPHGVLPYSTDWSGAGALVEEMRKRGFGFEIEIALEGGDTAQVIHYNRERGTCWKGARASGVSLPHALALAALKALGGGR